jgi:arylsulfatase A
MMETDWHVGRILEFLDEQKLAENTLVVFTSDNGPEKTWSKRAELRQHQSNGIYREGKRSIYEGGHRVPFFIRWPAKVKAGSTWDEPVCQTDLLATFAEMVGAKLPPDAGEDSDSFYMDLLGRKRGIARLPMIHHASSGRFAIRDGQWKLVMPHARSRVELYDLSTDPSEKKDLAKAHPEIVQRLTASITRVVLLGRSTSGPKQSNDTPLWADVGWIKGEPKPKNKK